MYKLVISDDEGKTIIVPLVRDLITVGRQDGNTIRLTERNVSRRHARFTRDDAGNYRIEDLGSYNGITLNGVKLEQAAEIKDGDRLGIGDYVIALRAEVPAATTRPSSAKRGSMPSGFNASPPARLVMVSSPAPGAEFSIGKPQVAIGRLEELDLCISHRSISREHARITQDAGSFEIEDLRSANGVRVNGHAVKKSALRSGDIVELGQVRFRFVGPGETYVFDPAEEQQLLLPATRSGPHRGSIVGLIVLAAVGGGSMAVLHDGNKQAGAAMREDAPPPSPAVDPTPSTEALPAAGGEQQIALALKQCQDALAGGRPADALRAADVAMALPGGSDQLAGCKRGAAESMRAQEAYEQGTKALAEHKLEDAYFLFAGIPDNHAYRDRPEVRTTIQRVAEDRLARARKQLKPAPSDARNLASSVLDMQDVPANLREEATRLVESSARTTPSPGPSPSQPSLVNTKPRPSAGEAGEDEEDPAKVARNCLARGDQRCVVKALEGKAETAQELALLIETYRALGETKKAVKHMETFVSRFATARQTPQYRQFIAKQEQ